MNIEKNNGQKGGETPEPRKGVKKQFFGCVLLFLGILNTLLSFKAGLKPDPFNYFLMILGAVILALGVWQNRE